MKHSKEYIYIFLNPECTQIFRICKKVYLRKLEETRETRFPDRVNTIVEHLNMLICGLIHKFNASYFVMNGILLFCELLTLSFLWSINSENMLSFLRSLKVIIITDYSLLIMIVTLWCMDFYVYSFNGVFMTNYFENMLSFLRNQKVIIVTHNDSNFFL